MIRYEYSPGLGRMVAVTAMDTGVEPRKRSKSRFAKVPLGWGRMAFQAIGNKAALVVIALLDAKFEGKTDTVALTRKWLKPLGVHRNTVARALRQLEAAGLVEVKRSPGNAPRVTLLSLDASFD